MKHWLLFILLSLFAPLLAFPAATSCKAAIGGCSISVTSGDKVIMVSSSPSASYCGTQTSSGQTLTCQISVASGDTVIIESSNGVASPTFSSTTPAITFTQRVSQQRQSTGAYTVVADGTAGSSGSATCSVDQGTTKSFWAMFCYDVGPLSGVDASNSATGASSAATTSVSTTQANDLLFVASSQQGALSSMNTGYVSESQMGNCGCQIADKLAGGSGTESVTSSASSSSWAIALVAYKTSGSIARHVPVFSSTSPSLTWTTELVVNGISDVNKPRGWVVAIADAVANATGTMSCNVDAGPVSPHTMFCYDNGPLGAIDAQNSAIGRSGSATTSVTTTVTGDLLFAAPSLDGAVPGSYSVNTGFTNQQDDSSTSGAIIADKTGGSPGTESATASKTSTGWLIGLIAYKPFTGSVIVNCAPFIICPGH